MGNIRKLALALLRGFLVASIAWMILIVPVGLFMQPLNDADTVWPSILVLDLWFAIGVLCGTIQAVCTWRRLRRHKIDECPATE